MASIGTKLFKIASQINVGKETIVAFLQAKGFSIENKATSTLTDDMVDLVMNNFQKEASAAQKQREKAATLAPAVAVVSDGNELHHSTPSVNAALHSSTESTSSSHDFSSETVAAPASIDSVQSAITTPAAESQPDPSSNAAKSDDSAAVGTVIVLDDASSRRRGKKTEIAKDTTPQVLDVGTAILGESASANDAQKGSRTQPQSTAPQSAMPQSSANSVQQTDQSAASSLTPNNAPIASVPSVTQEHTVQKSTQQVQQQEVVQNDAQTIVSTDAVAPSPTALPETTPPADADTATDDATEGVQDDEAGKRKRKKRIGEMEYFVDNAPYATPMPTGLTILGKIDLNAKPDRSAAKPPERRDDRPQRSGERSGGGDRSGDRPGDRGGQNRGGSGGNPPPRTGSNVGSSGKPPVTGAPKPKDWTKEGASNAPKRPGTGTSSPAGNAAANSKKKRKKGKREQVNAEDVDKAIRRTLAGQEESQLAMRTRLRQRRKQERADEQDRQAGLREAEEGILRVTEFITVAELANLMGVPTNDIILKCMGLGLMVSINQRLEKDTITLIADDYAYEVEFEDAFSEEALEEDDTDDEAFLTARAPIVTVMGHVDHGKTSLLDYIRNTSVVSGESGGITQHIGAYSVKMQDGKFITFLDTPGHQAFTAMRARGAQVTDLVVLVVAADDNVMPQTIEAISHARAANVPMVVAINKIDKPDANPDKVRQQLADQGVLVEEWGGKFQSTMISAKKGTNIDQLLEKILLEAEILNLRANADRLARGAVVEAKIDKGKGPVATVIVQKGTLHVGDSFLCGIYSGRVRAMFNEKGDRIEEVIPSTPVQILGFDGVPQAGDTFVAMESEVEAREIATTRQQIKREQDFKRVRHVTLDDIASRIKAGGVQELKIVLKADTDGSLEALTDSLQKISTEEVKVSIILRAVGAITESDVMLAAASEAVIVGFHVRPSAQLAKLAENEGVDIRLYRIIYDCINEIRLALEGMLQPEIREEVVGVAEVREVFKISKLGNIAGCYMLDGKINRNDTVRLMRDGFEVYTGRLASLKRIKEDVREVDTGFECGIAIDNFNDIQTGDLIEAVRKIEIKRKL
jgi:translation initiation factor IF-2